MSSRLPRRTRHGASPMSRSRRRLPAPEKIPERCRPQRPARPRAASGRAGHNVSVIADLTKAAALDRAGPAPADRTRTDAAPADRADVSDAAARGAFPDWRFPPNLAGRPDVYEIENRAVDSGGHVLAAMRTLAPWDGLDLVDLGCGTGYWLRTNRPKPQRVHHRNRARAHGENVAQNSADAGGRSLKRLDKRRVIVRLDFKSASPAVANVHDAGIFI